MLVGKEQQVAGLGKVVLGGKEGRRRHPPVAVRRHMGQGRAQQGAADAVAHRVQLLLAGLLQHLVDGAINAAFQVLVETVFRLVMIRVDPRADKDGNALGR